jgi:hypothetical protein
MSILPGPNVFLLYNCVRCLDHWNSWNGGIRLKKKMDQRHVVIERHGQVAEKLDDVYHQFTDPSAPNDSDNLYDTAVLSKDSIQQIIELPAFQETKERLSKDLLRARQQTIERIKKE